MRIIAITSSPKGKKSNTLRLVRMAAEAAEKEGAEVEFINIADLKLKYCTACGTCFKKGECPRKDSFNKVLKKMLDADGFIVSSPNYIEEVTGQMKVFMDRHCNVVHCLAYDGKYSISITTGGGNSGEHILKSMDTFMIKCGATALGGTGAAMSKGQDSMDIAITRSAELGTELVKAIKEKRVLPEQAAAHKGARAYFASMFINNKKDMADNYRHYVEKGWIKE
jgi:multimeric flavodoxin WrbA